MSITMQLAGAPAQTALRLPSRAAAPARCPLRVAARLRPRAPGAEPHTPSPSRALTSIPRSQQHEAGTPSSGSPGSSGGGALAAAAALAVLLPLADPGAAAAAADQASHSGSMYWTCVGLGTAGVVTTLLFTSRFLLSYFPGLEKRAKQRREAVLLRAVTAADPILDPITKGFFRMTEQGDLNYGATALLAVVSGVMTILLGHDGVLVERVPDLGMLWFLQYLVYFQHMLLLPMWVVVVFRYFLLI